MSHRDEPSMARKVPRRYQFRIGSLILMTLVTAVCAAMVRTLGIAGWVVSVPFVLALIRTLLTETDRSMVVYFRSVALVHGLLSVTLATVVTSALLSGLYLLHLASRLLVGFSVAIRDRLTFRRRMIHVVARSVAAVAEAIRWGLARILSRTKRVWAALGVTARTLGRQTMRRNFHLRGIS